VSSHSSGLRVDYGRTSLCNSCDECGMLYDRVSRQVYNGAGLVLHQRLYIVLFLFSPPKAFLLLVDKVAVVV
jgi:hypothetical protein